MSIEAYDYGKQDGKEETCKKLIEWIDQNRTSIEFEDGFTIYRDHFTSEDLVKFVESILDSKN